MEQRFDRRGWRANNVRLRLVPKGPPIKATNDEIAARLRELELAQERLRQRRALVARLVEDFHSNATLSAVLRKALVERDRLQEECDRLADDVARLQPD